MLTPAQIKNHQFTPAGRGNYKSIDVDEYLAEVAVSYEQMFKENGELIRKIGLLADKVEEYRNDEDNIRAALLTAQRMADKIVREAKESVEGKLSQAQAQSEAMVADATAKSTAMLQEARGRAEALTSSAQSEYDKLRSEAEQIAQEKLSESQRRAEEIVFEAEQKAEEQLSAVKRSVMHESLVLEMAKKEVSEFRSNLMSLYKTHIELINRMPAIAQEHMHSQEEEPQPVSDDLEQPESREPEEAQAEPVVEPDVPQLEPEVQAQPEEAYTQPEQLVQESEITLPVQEPEITQPVEVVEEVSRPIESEPEVMDDFSAAPVRPEPRQGGFRVHFDEIEEPVPVPESDKSLKFGPDYDVFNDDEEEGEEEDGHTNLAFRGFFKRK